MFSTSLRTKKRNTTSSATPISSNFDPKLKGIELLLNKIKIRVVLHRACYYNGTLKTVIRKFAFREPFAPDMRF